MDIHSSIIIDERHTPVRDEQPHLARHRNLKLFQGSKAAADKTEREEKKRRTQECGHCRKSNLLSSDMFFRTRAMLSESEKMVWFLGTLCRLSEQHAFPRPSGCLSGSSSVVRR